VNTTWWEGRAKEGKAQLEIENKKRTREGVQGRAYWGSRV